MDATPITAAAAANPMPADKTTAIINSAASKVVEVAGPSLATEPETTEDTTKPSRQNGLSDKSKEAYNPPAKSNDDDEAKPASLNNENDDRIDSIGVGGQGGGGDASSSSLENNGATVVVADDDLQDLEQSTTSKGTVAPADPTPTIEATTAIIEAKDNKPIVGTENGVEEASVESPIAAGKESKRVAEEALETVEDSATTAETAPIEDNDLAAPQETEIVTAEKDNDDVVVEPKEQLAPSADAENESLDAPLILAEDSQDDEEDVKVKVEKVSEQDENEIETIDIDTDDDDEEVDEGDIIDDDEDEEDESIESPPMELDDDADGRKEYLSEYDDVEEVDADDDDEDEFERGEELQVGEEYEDAEIDDEDVEAMGVQNDGGSDIELTEPTPDDEEDVEGVVPEEGQPKIDQEDNRGVKRKISEDSPETPALKQESKKRDTKW